MVRTSLHHIPTRREFLKLAGSATFGLAFIDGIFKDPYRPVKIWAPSASPVRISGRVTVQGKGLHGVAVSDGLTVAVTDAKGDYTLATSTHQEYVFVSLPSGVEVPMSPTGTARCFHRIAPNGDGEMQAVWDLRRAEGNDDRHGFLVLADPQTLDAADVSRYLSETVPDVQKLTKNIGHPLFAVGCGDLMFDKLEFFPEYERSIAMMGIPGFQVIGNHDVEVGALSDDASAKTFRRLFGPTYYSFNRGEVHYIVLDDVLWFARGYIGYVDDAQLQWMAQDLAHVEKGRTVVVCTHIPLFDKQHERLGNKNPSNSEVVTNRQAIYRLLEGYDGHIIVGHMHESEHLTDGGVRHHVCGAVCGGWWTGDICGDGTPNGYAVYEVHGSSLQWTYKSTGRSLDHQLRVYTRGAVAERPDALVANVWDANDKWQIVWYEDGMRAGSMQRFRGRDPLAVQTMDGSGNPKRHPWVDSYVTDHLYAASPSATAQKITVEATDQFGRAYSVNA